MKPPHDSVTGTVLTGLALTAVLVLVLRVLVSGG